MAFETTRLQTGVNVGRNEASSNLYGNLILRDFPYTKVHEVSVGDVFMTRVRYPMIPMLFEASLITQPRNSPPAFSSRKIQSWKQPRHERSEERTCFFIQGRKGGSKWKQEFLACMINICIVPVCIGLFLLQKKW